MNHMMGSQMEGLTDFFASPDAKVIDMPEFPIVELKPILIDSIVVNAPLDFVFDQIVQLNTGDLSKIISDITGYNVVPFEGGWKRVVEMGGDMIKETLYVVNEINGIVIYIDGLEGHCVLWVEKIDDHKSMLVFLMTSQMNGGLAMMPEFLSMYVSNHKKVMEYAYHS